jgi:hypothetical protein
MGMDRLKEKRAGPLKNRFTRSWNTSRKSLLWITLAGVILALDHVISTPVADLIYYRGFFIGWRLVYDYGLGFLPVPMIYLVSGFILFRIWTWWKQRQQGWKYLVIRAIGGIAALLVLFYVLWAFNYHQQPLPEHLGLNLQSVTQKDIDREFDRASDVLVAAANELPDSLNSDLSIRSKKVTDGELREDVKNALKTLDLPHTGRVRVRQLWPKGLLLRFSTAGIYIPQTGEGHIDDGLLSVQKPFTMAHEMAHGYGVTDEGACNFIAWLACDRSTDPWVHFSGALSYWQYAAVEMPQDSVEARMKSFPDIIERSIHLIRENDRLYPDLIPRYRDAIYTSYLKYHGVKEGLKSYNEVVLMVQQYIQKDSVSTDSK